jgi:hypothetical protein
MTTSPYFGVRELAFRKRLQKVDCTTPEQGRRFVAFALRCVESTPVTGGLTPAGLLQGRTPLLDALRLVKKWLTDESVSPELLGLDEDVLETAAAETGDLVADVTGLSAACWSVIHLHKAATTAIEAGDELTELNEVAGEAGLVADLARRSSQEAYTLAAVEFQERLFEQHFGAA